MKFVIQKETGLGETTVVELEGATAIADAPAAYKALDARLWDTNAKIADVRDFVNQIKDPNYRYLFVSFFDSLMGISSQAEPLARKFKVDPPLHFDEWMQKRQAALQEVPKK